MRDPRISARFKLKPLKTKILQPTKVNNFEVISTTFAIEEVFLLHGNNIDGTIVASQTVDTNYKPPSAIDLLPPPPDFSNRIDQAQSSKNKVATFYLNRQRTIARAIAGGHFKPDNIGLANLVGLQWLYDKGGIQSRLPVVLFNSEDQVPPQLGLQKTALELLKAYKKLGQSMDTTVRLRVDRSNSSNYASLLRRTLNYQAGKKPVQNFCDLLIAKGALGDRNPFKLASIDYTNMINQ